MFFNSSKKSAGMQVCEKEVNFQIKQLKGKSWEENSAQH